MKALKSVAAILAIQAVIPATSVLADEKASVKRIVSTPAGKPSKLISLSPSSAQVILADTLSTARILIDGIFPDGKKDLTGIATFTMSDTKIAAINERNIIEAQNPGKTILTVKVVLNGVTKSCSVPIIVVNQAKTPQFASDIMPILTKSGCNAGACHGSNAGKGGFHLSLLGYDPKSDHEAMTRFVGSRRISLSQPDNSLILRKATARIPHGGALRFFPDSSEYRTLKAWISGGALAPKDTEPTVKKLLVSPENRSLAIGGLQSYKIEAALSDGSKRDVTARTLFTSGDGSILEVKPDGSAKVVGSGEGAVVIRYGGVFTAARLTAPYGKPIVEKTSSSLSPIDLLINSKLAGLGVPLSERCTDAEFLRRASLDVTGALPKPEEVKSFLASPDPRKREKLADRLLSSDAYIDFWTLKWSDLLRNSQRSLLTKGMKAYHQWIRESVKTNKPWDKFVREILTAKGSGFQAGEVNYYRTGTDPDGASVPLLTSGNLKGASASSVMIHGDIVVAKFLPRKGPSGWPSQLCMSRADQSLSRHRPKTCASAASIGTLVPCALPVPTKIPTSSS